MKRLLLTCTDLMAIQFLVPHVKYLSQNGFSVELACSAVGGRMDELRQALQGVAEVRQVHLVRSPFSPGNRRGYGELKGIIDGQRWDVIWTNEPVMGVMTRLAARGARKRGTKVVYMVHGFHFYHGAPARNWLLYYPVERYCSRLCDMIITINQEDFQRAKTFHANRVEKINGIGLDTQKFSACQSDRHEKRISLGIPEDAFFVVSVGELKVHKNHKVMIRALAKTGNPQMYYGICGTGEGLQPLQSLARKLGVGERVKFFGYRKDVPEILHCADLFAFPSKRDGLGLAALEAMAAHLPLLTSNIRGVSDYVFDGVTGYRCAPDDAAGFAKGLARYFADRKLCSQIGENNAGAAKKYDICKIEKDVCALMDFNEKL